MTLILLDKDFFYFKKLISHPYILYTSVGLIVLSLILAISKIKNTIILGTPSFIGLVGIFALFYFCIIQNKEPFYINPFGILTLYIGIPCFIFISIFFYKQTYLMMLNLTTKQYESILLYKQSLSNTNSKAETKKHIKDFESTNGEYYLKLINGLSCSQKFKNIIKFLCKKKPKSLIH